MSQTGRISTCRRGIDVVYLGRISTYRSGMDLIVEWKIGNFFTLPERNGACYYSADFSFDGEMWCLRIYPSGSGGRNSYGYVDLDLCKLSSRSITQAFSLSIKTAKGERYNEVRSTKVFGEGWSEIHFLRFVTRNELSKKWSDLIPKNALTVLCTMKKTTISAGGGRNDPEYAYVGASIQRVAASTQTVVASTQTVVASAQLLGASAQLVGASTQTMETSTQTVEEKYEATESGSSTNSQENEALHDFKELFLKKEDCDVTIKVKSSEFPAHRVILKARSPVLASTFRHDMKESATGVLEINDCDPSTFSDFLCFLYCADVQMITQKNVFDLFTLADKYQVLGLRSKCLEFMKNNLTVDTFCETITLALRHSETEMIKLSTDYFTKNAAKIIVTVKWQTFLVENPTESNELFIKLLVPNRS